MVEMKNFMMSMTDEMHKSLEQDVIDRKVESKQEALRQILSEYFMKKEKTI